MICRGYRQGALAQIHLISNDKSSAVINNLNGFRICDRWGKEEKRSQDGVPNSQRGDFTYMSLRLGGWDRRLIQDHGGAVRKGGGWEVLSKRRGREELVSGVSPFFGIARAAAAPGPRSMACTSDGRGRVLGCRLRQCPPSPLRRLRRLPTSCRSSDAVSKNVGTWWLGKMSYALPTVTYLMNETALNVLLALTFQLTSIERPFNASSRIAGASYGHHHGDNHNGKHAIGANPHTKTRACIDDGFRRRPVLARWLGTSAKAIYELNIVPVLLRVPARPLENKLDV
jgi:hypothetical protein